MMCDKGCDTIAYVKEKQQAQVQHKRPLWQVQITRNVVFLLFVNRIEKFVPMNEQVWKIGGQRCDFRARERFGKRKTLKISSFRTFFELGVRKICTTPWQNERGHALYTYTDISCQYMKNIHTSPKECVLITSRIR